MIRSSENTMSHNKNNEPVSKSAMYLYSAIVRYVFPIPGSLFLSPAPSLPGHLLCKYQVIRLINLLYNWNWHTSLLQTSLIQLFIFLFRIFELADRSMWREITKIAMPAHKHNHKNRNNWWIFHFQKGNTLYKNWGQEQPIHFFLLCLVLSVRWSASLSIFFHRFAYWYFGNRYVHYLICTKQCGSMFFEDRFVVCCALSYNRCFRCVCVCVCVRTASIDINHRIGIGFWICQFWFPLLWLLHFPISPFSVHLFGSHARTFLTLDTCSVVNPDSIFPIELQQSRLTFRKFADRFVQMDHMIYTHIHTYT